MTVLAGLVLLLLLVVEVAAWAAYGVWGWTSPPSGLPRALLVWSLPLAVVVAWALLASPRARYGGRGVRPAVKALVFGGAVLALADAGHAGWAWVLAVASVVANALALLPAVRALVPDASSPRP